MKFSIFFLLLLSLNSWSQDGEMHLLNSEMVGLESFSFDSEGNVTLDPVKWDKKTVQRTKGSYSVIYSRVGRDLTAKNSNNNLVQIDFEVGKVSQISQDAPYNLMTSEIESGKVMSITSCSNALCITVNDFLCGKIATLFKSENFKKINEKVSECSKLAHPLQQFEELLKSDEVVETSQKNISVLSNLNDEKRNRIQSIATVKDGVHPSFQNLAFHLALCTNVAFSAETNTRSTKTVNKTIKGSAQ